MIRTLLLVFFGVWVIWMAAYAHIPLLWTDAILYYEPSLIIKVIEAGVILAAFGLGMERLLSWIRREAGKK